jgi:tripartite-type tricarboxylate transporter receptor subunit TctC
MKKIFLGLFLCLATVLAQAQTVKIVVPFVPGGIIDRVARTLEQTLTTELGMQSVVEYKTGAGGSIATRYVASNKKSETVLLLHSNAVVTNSLSADAGYDLQNDLISVAHIGDAHLSLITGNKSNIIKMADLLSYNQTTPVFFGSSGVGAANHIAAEVLKSQINRNLIHVPYKGESAALTGIMSNDIGLLFITTTIAENYYKGNEVRVLAITGHKRTPEMPDVPTFSELGIKEVDNAINYIFLFANTTADPNVIKQIKATLSKTLFNPKTAKPYITAGVEPDLKKFNSKDFIMQDIERSKKIISKISIDK